MNFWSSLPLFSSFYLIEEMILHNALLASITFLYVMESKFRFFTSLTTLNVVIVAEFFSLPMLLSSATMQTYYLGGSTQL